LLFANSPEQPSQGSGVIRICAITIVDVKTNPPVGAGGEEDLLLNREHSASSLRRIANYDRLTGAKPSLLDAFAERLRLKITLDDCRDQVIRGKHGDLSDFCDGEHLCATFWGNGPGFSRLRARRIRLALEGEYGQPWTGGIGGDEAVILFSPSDERSAAFFIRALGVRRKRRVNPEIIERLGPTLNAPRLPQGGHFRPVKRPEA
jgi:hypothetical protein